MSFRPEQADFFLLVVPAATAGHFERSKPTLFLSGSLPRAGRLAQREISLRLRGLSCERSHESHDPWRRPRHAPPPAHGRSPQSPRRTLRPHSPRNRRRPEKSRLFLPRRSKESRRALPPPQRRRHQHHRRPRHAPIPRRKSCSRHPSRPIPQNFPPPPLRQPPSTPRPPRRSRGQTRTCLLRGCCSFFKLATRHWSLATSPRLLWHPHHLPPPSPHAHRRRRLFHHPFLSPPLRPRRKNPSFPRRPILLARLGPPRRPRPSRPRSPAKHSPVARTSPSTALPLRHSSSQQHDFYMGGLVQNCQNMSIGEHA